MPKLYCAVLATGLMLAAATGALAMGGGGSPGGFFGATQSPGPTPEYAPPHILRSYNAIHHHHHRHG